MSHDSYAIDNAKAHLKDFCLWDAAADACIDEQVPEDQKVVRFLRDECDFDGTNWAECLERIDQLCTDSALCAEVRSGWYDICRTGKTLYPDEFRITLTIGGPALWITGTLDDCALPGDVKLIYADQTTPPTELSVSETERDALLWYAAKFYFGS